MSNEFFSETTTVDETEYSVFKIYTAATDGRGHHSSVSVNLPPNQAAIINQIVQSRKISAYKTVNDFIRDSIYHRIKHVSDHYDNMLSDKEKAALAREFAIQEMERDQQLADNLRDAINSLREHMATAIERKDYDTLKQLILSGREIQRHCGEPWWSKLAQALDPMERVLLKED